MRTKANDGTPVTVTDTLKQLGGKLREARIRLGWTQREFAARIGVHETTLLRLEAGGTSVATVVLARALDLLGGLQGLRELHLNPNPKMAPLTPADAVPRRRAGGARVPRRVNVENYPQLKQLAWNRTVKDIDAQDALALYERNWRFIDLAALKDKEARLIDGLKKKYGHGVLNV